MQIDVDKGTFKINAKRIDLSGLTNPVTIKLDIGTVSGEATITMNGNLGKYSY